MSIVSVDGQTYKLLWAGQTANHTDAGVREYTSVYLVHTDNPNDGPAYIIDEWDGPYFGDTYTHGTDFDIEARLVSLTPERVEGSRLLWKVTAQWRWEFLDPQGKGQQKPELGVDEDGDLTDDPEEFRDEIEVSYALLTVPVERAVAYLGGFTGKAAQVWAAGKKNVPVVNSAFVVLDPPLEKDDARKILRLTKNLAAYPVASSQLLINKINRGQWNFNKQKLGYVENFANHAAKMQNISGSLQRQNGKNFWKVTFEIHINYDTWAPVNSPVPGGAGGPKGWDVEIVDRGIHARMEEGDDDGKGGTVSASDLINGVPQVRRLTDQYGGPLSEPVLFDGDGKPINSNQQTVYLGYQIYEDAVFPQL